MSKFAIISHIFPPSPSGQAAVLFRLLKALPPDRYFLISAQKIEKAAPSDEASEKLPARYYALKRSLRLPEYNRSLLFSFNIAVNALWGIYRRARQIERIAQQEGCSLLIACTGDLYDLPAVYLASKRTGIPFIPYVFDDYRYQWTGFYRTIARWLEPDILKHAKALIVPNEFMQQEYRNRYGIDSAVIHNPCILPDMKELDNAPKVFDSHEINIIYTGSVYHAHYSAFRNLLAAIKLLSRSDVKVHIYTAQPKSVLERNGLAAPMVVYHPHVKHSDVPIITRQADILFLPLAFESAIPEVVRTSAPGKLGDYLAVGRPILVHAPTDSFVSWYFNKHQCGIVVDKNDPAVLAATIHELIADNELKQKLGTRARTMAEKDFSEEVISDKFIKIIRGVADGEWRDSK